MNIKSKVLKFNPKILQNMDLADELSKILSEQISKEIDKDILRSLGFEPDRNKRRKNSIKKIYRL